jgi:hypothetical protein
MVGQIDSYTYEAGIYIDQFFPITINNEDELNEFNSTIGENSGETFVYGDEGSVYPEYKFSSVELGTQAFEGSYSLWINSRHSESFTYGASDVIPCLAYDTAFHGNGFEMTGFGSSMRNYLKEYIEEDCVVDGYKRYIHSIEMSTHNEIFFLSKITGNTSSDDGKSIEFSGDKTISPVDNYDNTTTLLGDPNGYASSIIEGIGDGIFYLMIPANTFNNAGTILVGNTATKSGIFVGVQASIPGDETTKDILIPVRFIQGTTWNGVIFNATSGFSTGLSDYVSSYPTWKADWSAETTSGKHSAILEGNGIRIVYVSGGSAVSLSVDDTATTPYSTAGTATEGNIYRVIETPEEEEKE